MNKGKILMMKMIIIKKNIAIEENLIETKEKIY
jgi:hypothetical protein